MLNGTFPLKCPPIGGQHPEILVSVWQLYLQQASLSEGSSVPQWDATSLESWCCQEGRRFAGSFLAGSIYGAFFLFFFWALLIQPSPCQAQSKLESQIAACGGKAKVVTSVYEWQPSLTGLFTKVPFPDLGLTPLLHPSPSMQSSTLVTGSHSSVLCLFTVETPLSPTGGGAVPSAPPQAHQTNTSAANTSGHQQDVRSWLLSKVGGQGNRERPFRSAPVTAHLTGSQCLRARDVARAGMVRTRLFHPKCWDSPEESVEWEASREENQTPGSCLLIFSLLCLWSPHVIERSFFLQRHQVSCEAGLALLIAWVWPCPHDSEPQQRHTGWPLVQSTGEGSSVSGAGLLHVNPGFTTGE